MGGSWPKTYVGFQWSLPVSDGIVSGTLDVNPSQVRNNSPTSFPNPVPLITTHPSEVMFERNGTTCSMVGLRNDKNNVPQSIFWQSSPSFVEGVDALVSSSTAAICQAVAEVDAHLIVVPANPLLRNTPAAPLVGLSYPTSAPAGSVQAFGGVNPAGFAALPTSAIVGLLVSQSVENVTDGVPPAGPFTTVLLCFEADCPVRLIPATRHTVMIAPVAPSPVESNVTVIDDAVESALATNT